MDSIDLPFQPMPKLKWEFDVIHMVEEEDTLEFLSGVNKMADPLAVLECSEKVEKGIHTSCRTSPLSVLTKGRPSFSIPASIAPRSMRPFAT